MRILSYVVIVVGLTGNHGCVPTLAHSYLGQESAVQMDQQGEQEFPVDAALTRRWSELFANIIEQFRAERRDMVGNLEGDFTTREVRVRATSKGDNDSLWVSKTFTENQLRTANLHKAARDIYAAAKRKAGEL